MNDRDKFISFLLSVGMVETTNNHLESGQYKIESGDVFFVDSDEEWCVFRFDEQGGIKL